MTRRTLISIATFTILCPSTALATLIPRIAITTEDDGSIDAATLARLTSRISGALLRSNHFQVVDRARLSAALREQGLSNSAYADPKTAASLGKIVGASRILHLFMSIEASESSGAYLTTHQVDAAASFTLVGVDTARIVAAGNASGSAQRQAAGSGEQYSAAMLRREAVDACADDIVVQIDVPVGDRK